SMRGRCGKRRHALREKIVRRALTQVRVVSNLQGSLPRPFAQISFGPRLQPPSDAPDQKLAVGGARFLSQDLAIPSPQCGRFQLPETLDFGRDGWVHVVRFLSWKR